MKTYTRALTTALTFGLAFTIVPAAEATVRGPYQIGVSCDGVQTEFSPTVGHVVQGTISFKVVSANQNSMTNAQLVDKTRGRNISTQTISSGDKVSWQGMAVGDYFYRMNRSGAKNCNAALPGAGNYVLKYEIYYNG